MKPLSFIKQLALAMTFTVVSLNATSGFADGGASTGGGVGLAVSDVKDLINETFYRVISDWNFPGDIDIEKFAHAIETTRIVTPKHVYEYVDGNRYEVDATNDPISKLISVSETRFPKIKSLDARRRLIFHEYLGIMKLDKKKSYEISSKLSNNWVHPLSKFDNLKLRSQTTHNAYKFKRASTEIESAVDLLKFKDEIWYLLNRTSRPDLMYRAPVSLTLNVTPIDWRTGANGAHYRDDYEDFVVYCHPITELSPDTYFECYGQQPSSSGLVMIEMDILKSGTIKMKRTYPNEEPIYLNLRSF